MSRLRTRSAILLMVAGMLSAPGAAAPTVRLELIEVNKIWDAAPHNAFTDLIRFKGQWYCGFREGDSHSVSGQGNVRVIRSDDGAQWVSVARLDIGPEYDMRDAKLNVTSDGRLMLNTAAAPLAASSQRQSLVWFSDDGANWSDGPHPVGEPNWWLWGVQVHPDGTCYGVGYGDTTTHPRTTRLYRSTDGIHYETIVPTLTAEPETGETAMLFLDDGTAVALVRDNTGAERSFIGTSSGDYTQWTFRTADKRVGGPELIALANGTILAASRLHAPTVRTSLSWLDPEAGQLVELLTLPSGGDTSYPGMVWHEDELWVSYYSSHEGRTSIYLAKVKVEPVVPPEVGTRFFQEESLPDPGYSAGAAHIRTDLSTGESDLLIIGEAADHEKTLRGVFSFDLSGLPPGSRISEVSLTLCAQRDNTGGTGGPSVDGEFRLELYQLDRAFVEGEVSWSESAAGQPWARPGGDYKDVPLAGLQANPFCLLSEGPIYTWQSTPQFVQAAQEALDAAAPLCLLLRTPDGEAQEGRVMYYFYSDDGGSPEQHPLLAVRYSPLPGDANQDGKVDDLDASILAANWQRTGEATWAQADFNGDGDVNDLDASILAANWQSGVGAGVPEPGAIPLLLALGGFALLRRKRRQSILGSRSG